jgi:hypothetical protein
VSVIATMCGAGLVTPRKLIAPGDAVALRSIWLTPRMHGAAITHINLD